MSMAGATGPAPGVPATPWRPSGFVGHRQTSSEGLWFVCDCGYRSRDFVDLHRHQHALRNAGWPTDRR
jgi:hypothetical protein